MFYKGQRQRNKECQLLRGYVEEGTLEVPNNIKSNKCFEGFVDFFSFFLKDPEGSINFDYFKIILDLF